MNVLLRFIPLLIAATLAIGTWWLADLQHRNYVDPKASSPTTPDFIVDNARMSRLGADGAVQTLVSADRLVHYLKDDRSVLDKPRVLQTRVNQPPVTMTSDNGETRNRLAEVLLTSNVRVTRAATVQSPALDMRTEQLVIHPDEDRASSDVEVHIEQAGSTLDGIGMDFDNSYRVLKVRNRVRAMFPPRKKDAS